MNTPFEFKQRIIKLAVDKIVLDLNEDWFRLKGVLREKYPLSDTIESTPVGRDTRNRTFFVTSTLRRAEITVVVIAW